MTSTSHASLDIERVVAGGDGLARHDGLVVFVPRTLPGERVRARVRVKGTLGRGTLESVERPSPARVEPPCVHYTRDDCGGCQLQHATYDEQRRIKASIVVEAFRRIAHINIEPPVVHAAPDPWRYRRKLTLALRRDGTGWRAGLRPWHDPDRVFRLDDCLITSERVMHAWREIIAAAEHLPVATELRGAVQSLGDACAFHLEGGREWPQQGAFVRATPSLATISWTPGTAGRRVVHARDGMTPSGGFVQVNADVATVVLAHVVDAVASRAPAHVIDAYAGSGDGAERIAATGARVTAIEVDRDAVRIAADRLRPPSRVIADRVERVIATALPADVVVLNPPRTGVDAAVCDALHAARPSPGAIIYVSCDPATLARDVARLQGWRVGRLVCFDMFPQTSHVETVCELVPEAA